MRFSVSEGSEWEIHFAGTSSVQVVRVKQHFSMTSTVNRKASPECDSALLSQIFGR